MVSFNGNSVSYDLDGNMLNNGADTYTYDSANRLITAGGHTYTYNAEDIRIRDLCLEEDTAYTYNNNCKLSKLLMKTSGGTVTKYVYGRGLIGEETGSEFKTYHFDCRGSTAAITDISGNITDTFAYDTYGRLTTRTGSTPIIFGYNGRDGVITDKTGLIYMRARYYSPDMKRFINADVVAGKLSSAITLNRYAYANGNPVSFVDPFGLSSERENDTETDNTIDRIYYINSYMESTNNALYKLLQSWGISLTEEVYATDNYIDILFGGFTVKLHVDVSFAIPIETNVESDIDVDSGYAIHEVVTPELTLPWTDIAASVGAYADGDRLGVGLSAYARDGSWTYGVKYQLGVYSEASIISLEYKPEDEYLPTVTVSLDSEIHYLAKAAVALVSVAVAYAPQVLIAAAPAAADFIQQLGSMTPAFG